MNCGTASGFKPDLLAHDEITQPCLG
jgi:hypothetical protein